MKRIIATLSLLLASFLVLASDLPPDVLVKDVTNDVLAIVRQDKGIQSGDTRKAIDLVEAKVLPHFDFKHMTALAVGRDWRTASPAQQDQLTCQAPCTNRNRDRLMTPLPAPTLRPRSGTRAPELRNDTVR